MKPLRIFNPVTKTILLALMLSITSLLVAQNVTSAAISERLKVVKSHAALAEDDAATLKSYAFSRLSWESHSARVSLMKEHINALIKDYNDLAEMRPDAVPWQQEAIDRIEPLVRESVNDVLTC